KNIDLQDILIIPVSPTNYPDALEMIYSVYWKTRELLIKKGYNAYLLADEGGFGPALPSNEAALEVLGDVFHSCGYKAGSDVAIALDVASSHFYNTEKKEYHLHSEDRILNSTEMIDML